jgi:hypothetical protein
VVVPTSEPLPDDGQVWPKHVAQLNFKFSTVLSSAVVANKFEFCSCLFFSDANYTCNRMQNPRVEYKKLYSTRKPGRKVHIERTTL